MRRYALTAILGLAPVGAATLLAVSAAPAFGAESGPLVIEEVIVTARKREESAQEVPVAITALSSELAQSTIRDLTDLNGFAPNVRIDSDRSRNNATSITIRGISPTRTDDNSFDSPIAVMIDGIYLGALGGQLIENFDIDRVEILRGPQGTLFGKNTVGGVVNVLRSRPTGEYGGRFKLTAGKWDQREFRAVMNAPIVEDKLAGKVFFTSIKNDGFLYNSTLERRMPETDYQNYGLTLLATPNDRFEALFTVEKFDDDSELGAFLTNYNLAPGVAAAPSDPRQQNLSGGFLACTLFASRILPQWDSDVPCRTSLDIPKEGTTDLPNPASTEVDAYTLTMTYDLNDSMRLVSRTGLRDMVEDRIYDFDGTSSNHITIERLNDYEQFSQELQLEATWNKVSFVVGGYYWNSEFEQDWVTGGEFWKFVGTLSGYDLTNNTWLPGSGEGQPSPLEQCWAGAFGNVRCDTGASLAGLGAAYTQRLLEEQETESIAFYAQGDWEFAENWTLTAGLRWTRETKDFMAGQAYLAPIDRQRVKNFPEFAVLDNKWSEISPKVGLSYQWTDDVLFYASYSEGFHSGGFFGVNQNVADFERDQYDPEFAHSWEAGVKSQLLNNRVQFNAAYFYNDFEDKQEQAVQFDATTNTVATVFDNVATATYQGIEVEVQWVASEYLNLFASFGWLDASYDEFETDLNPNDDVLVGGPEVVDATHLTPRNAPEVTYGLGGTFTYPVGTGEVAFYVKYDWVDEIETSLINLDVGRVDSRENLTASVAYSYNNMQLTLFGRNLTDEVYEVPAIIFPLFAAGTIIPGSSWGLEFSIDM